jgi:DNA processing protein
VDDAGRTRRRLIALSLASGLGAVRIARLVDHFGSVDALWEAPGDALARVRGFGRATAAAVIAARGQRAADRVDAALRRAARCGVTIATWLDAAYPARLRGIPASPPVVYIRGAAARDGRPAVAIVGTRRATPYGLGVAERLAGVLGGRSVDIVSGLARGIDAAAHRGALQSGGCTVGVLGCGVDVVYPPEHGSLMEAMICGGGAVIAEAPIGTPPGPGLFPARNRLISGMADAVVVVEGGADSGAMITASRAIEQGRILFAVPGSVYAPGSLGPHRLLAGGAKLLTAPDDVLAVLDGVGSPGRMGGGGPREAGSTQPVRPAGTAVQRRRLEGISSAEQAVFRALDADEARSVDDVARAARIGVAAAAAALVALEVRGAVRRAAGGLYVQAVDDRTGTGGTAWRDHWS